MCSADQASGLVFPNKDDVCGDCVAVFVLKKKCSPLIDAVTQQADV